MRIGKRKRGRDVILIVNREYFSDFFSRNNEIITGNMNTLDNRIA